MSISPADWYNFRGQTAVVTGGAGVLGTAICRALASAGARVAVLDLRPEPAELLAAELGGGASRRGLQCAGQSQRGSRRAKSDGSLRARGYSHQWRGRQQAASHHQRGAIFLRPAC